MPRPRLAALALLFLSLMAIYIATAYRSVGPGDSGELTTALSTWGVAHAPGYPLLSLMGNLVSHLIPAEPALTLNLLNAVFSALACVVIADAVAVTTASLAAGVLAGLALGTSRVFWSQALALEVFSLNALMAALLIDLLCRFLIGRSKPRAVAWTLPAAVLVATTTITHHLTLGLIALPVAAVLVWTALRAPGALLTRRVWLRCAIACVAGLAALLYIPAAAHFHPVVNWGDVHDLDSFIRILTRRDFGGGTLMSPGIVVNQVLVNGEKASPAGMRHFFTFWTELPRDFGWLSPIAALFGCYWISRNSRPLLIVVAGFLVLLTLFFTRVNTPVLAVYHRVTEAFFVLPHVVIAFIAGCGFAWLIGLAHHVRLPRAATSAALAAGGGLAMLIANLSMVDQHRNTFVRDFGSNLLAGMPQRSIFLSTGELFWNSLLYDQQVLGFRRDVSVVDQDLLVVDWYVNQVLRRLQAPNAQPRSSLAWLDSYAGRSAVDPRHVLMVQLLDGSYAPSYRLIPLGIWSIAMPRDQVVDVFQWERKYAAIVGPWKLESLDREYPPDSWEASEGAFYTYAIGQLEGLRDLAQVRAPGRAAFTSVAAIDHAERWTARRRADLLGFRSDFLRTCLSDSLVPLIDAEARKVASRAMVLADSSLAIDPANIQALHAKAALMSLRLELADSTAELAIRQRIVDQRPGDFGELIPYFRLALRLGAGDRDGEIERRAEATHERLIGLLKTCAKIDRGREVAQSIAYWSQPLERIPSLR